MISLLRNKLKRIDRCHDGDGCILNYRPFQKGGDGQEVDFIDLVVVPPSSSIGRHRHGNNQEWYVVLDGDAQMWIDGRVAAVSCGDIIVNPPFGEHGFVNTSTRNVLILVFQLSACDAARQAASEP